MPIYFLSLFTISSSVANGMKALFRNFLRNDSIEHHKHHLVDWKSRCKLLENGGLGIKKLWDHNRALLAKWPWRFVCKQVESLWRKVVVARFGLASCWMSKEVREHHGCGLWKSISTSKQGFWEGIRFKLGDGSNKGFGWMCGLVIAHLGWLFRICLGWRWSRGLWW